MEDFVLDIENALQTLSVGEIVFFPANFGWVLAVDATQHDAVIQLQKLANANNLTSIILMSDERQLMQHVATLDLEVFNFLDEQTSPTTMLYNNIIGLSNEALCNNGEAFIVIDTSQFAKTLIKRFRQPLFALQLDAAINYSHFAQFVVTCKQPNDTTNTSLQFYKWIDNKAVIVRNL